MSFSFTYLPYDETGFFSDLVSDYLTEHQQIRRYYNYSPNANGVDQAIKERTSYQTDRQTLVAVLTKQYEHLPVKAETEKNIQALLNENTFTVCTAHQPNLLTGYLYFVYKILHTIKLATELNKKYPEKHFVPVYYMGSEDNDLDELGTFRFRGDKYTWNGDGQSGAVGRMKTKGLKPLLNELFKLFGPPGKNCDDLQNLITDSYLKHDTIATATQYLVHELFGRCGLIVLNPDEASLKRAFIPLMQDELLNSVPFAIVNKQTEQLSHNYKVQAHPRPVNLFYLADNLRERIERHGEEWMVVNSDKKWNQQQLIDELNEHPERFSPNVILRGLFQETILPNVAFIGGGAEVAYWMQFKLMFEHYKVFLPCVLLRQSIQVIDPASSALRKQLELNVTDVFKLETELIKKQVAKYVGTEWQITGEAKELEKLFETLKAKATAVDPTLKASSEAALTKMKYQLRVLEQKMFRAEKRKIKVHTDRIKRMKKLLFPNNLLQERVDNFMEHYLDMGPAFFDTILDGIKPLTLEFLVVE